MKKLSVAVSLALALPLAANAAGLGKLTVLSALGQPLRAEIELTSVSKEEEGSLVARLASADAFRKANIDVNPVLSSLRFSVEQRQGKQLIRITSAQAINEPFVDLLLELSGGGSRQVREYTFLLDPPDLRKPQTAQAAPTPAPVATPPAAAKAPVAEPKAPAVGRLMAAVTPPATSSTAPAPSAPATPMGSTGDEEPVSKIVTKAAPSSLAEELISKGRSEQSEATNAPVPPAVAEKTAPSMAAAKTDAPASTGKRGGKEAEGAARTEGGKSYRVKEGDTLAQIAGRTKDNTVSLDQMLVALYRANPDAFIGNNINRLRAGRVLSVPDAATAGAVDKSEARTTVVAQAQDFNAYRNKLAGQVASGPARKAADSRQSSSGKVTARVEEKTAANEAKDKLQLSKAGAGKGDKAAAEKAAAEDKIAADKAIAEANERVKELEKNVSDLQKLLEVKNKTLAELSEQQKAAAKPEAAPATPAAAAAEAKPETAAPATDAAKPEQATAPAAPPPVVAEKPKPMPVPVPAPVAKPGFFDHVLDNPFTLPAGGLLIALLAGLGFVRARNGKKKASATSSGEPAKEEEPAAVAQATSSAPEVAAAAATVAAAEETPAPAVEAAAEPEPEPEAAADAVDPIAEADMYISYGREEQAEDILRLALKSEPERQAIRLKLLEIYAKRPDVDAFNDVARELHAATGGMGEEWTQAAAMGILLDPTNPLYGGAAEEEPAVVEPEVVPEPVPEPEPAPQPEEDPGLEFDLSDFKGAEIQAGAAPVADIGSKIDFDLELDNGAKADADSAAALLDDLPEPEAPAAPAAPAAAPIELDLPEPAEPPPVDVLEDEESAFAAEMSTKLDLAAAYQEIGDKEGARELLDEVIRGGSDSQVERAKDMLSKLS